MNQNHYNGYNFYGSSYNNYMYVPNYNWNGFGSNVGYNSYCNNGWGNNSFGYNNGWGNNNYYNSPLYGGWGNQYGNNYNNNNYGYNNSYDYNSNVYNGPRISHSGGNSRQVINPGMANGRLMSQPILDNSSPKTAMPPTDIKRFDQVAMPKQNMVKGNDNNSDNSDDNN